MIPVLMTLEERVAPAQLPLTRRASQKGLTLVLGLPLVFTVVSALVAAHPAVAQESWEKYKVDAVKVEQRPRIDGVLDEAVWQGAAVIDQFVQQEPDEGAPATEKTEVRVLYDGRSLFLGVRAFDSNPEGVVATEMRRDGDRILDEDNFQVILDTFMDRKTAYMFVVTPLGAQLDQQVFDEGGRDRGANGVNRDWDGVWSVATSRAPGLWVAEIEIPMVTLRFPDADPQSWGINFMRTFAARTSRCSGRQFPRRSA